MDQSNALDDASDAIEPGSWLGRHGGCCSRSDRSPGSAGTAMAKASAKNKLRELTQKTWNFLSQVDQRKAVCGTQALTVQGQSHGCCSAQCGE